MLRCNILRWLTLNNVTMVSLVFLRVADRFMSIRVCKIGFSHMCKNSKIPIWCARKQRILGECLLISSLPGMVLRMLVDIARLAERFNMRSQSRAW